MWILIKCRRPTRPPWRNGSPQFKEEEALASVTHNVAEVDKWEGASFKEDDLRGKVKAAKKRYEKALREKFFGF